MIQINLLLILDIVKKRIYPLFNIEKNRAHMIVIIIQEEVVEDNHLLDPEYL